LAGNEKFKFYKKHLFNFAHVLHKFLSSYNFFS
jgi:hypothetical protein